MRRSVNHVKLVKAAVVALLLAGLSSYAHGQTQRYLLEETTAKPGQTQAFEAGQKDYCAAVVRGGAPSCTVLSGTTFSPSGLYFVMLAFGSFAHYDEGTYTSKGLTPEQAAELGQRRGPTIANNVESAIELQDSASYPGAGSFSLASVLELHLRPGTSRAFLKLLEEVVKPAAQKVGAGTFEVYRTVAGGDPNRFFVVRRLHTFAELNLPDPMQGAVPEAQHARFDQVISQSVESSLVRVMRLRPDVGAEHP